VAVAVAVAMGVAMGVAMAVAGFIRIHFVGRELREAEKRRPQSAHSGQAPSRSPGP
jgi:hypothetical protein